MAQYPQSLQPQGAMATSYAEGAREGVVPGGGQSGCVAMRSSQP